jgi:hypothetical protein
MDFHWLYGEPVQTAHSTLKHLNTASPEYSTRNSQIVTFLSIIPLFLTFNLSLVTGNPSLYLEHTSISEGPPQRKGLINSKHSGGH